MIVILTTMVGGNPVLSEMLLCFTSFVSACSVNNVNHLVSPLVLTMPLKGYLIPHGKEEENRLEQGKTHWASALEFSSFHGDVQL